MHLFQTSGSVALGMEQKSFIKKYEKYFLGRIKKTRPEHLKIFNFVFVNITSSIKISLKQSQEDDDEENKYYDVSEKLQEFKLMILKYVNKIGRKQLDFKEWEYEYANQQHSLGFFEKEQQENKVIVQFFTADDNYRMKLLYMRQQNAENVIDVIKESMSLQNTKYKLDLKSAGIKNFDAVRLKEQRVKQKYPNVFIVHQNLELFFFGYDAKDAEQSIQQELIQLQDIHKVIKLENELIQLQFNEESKMIREQSRKNFDVLVEIDKDEIALTGQPFQVELALKDLENKQAKFGGNIVVEQEWNVHKNLEKVFPEEVKTFQKQFRIQKIGNDLITGINFKFQEYKNAIQQFHKKKYQEFKIKNVENISLEEVKDFNLEAIKSMTQITVKNKKNKLNLTIKGYEAHIYEFRVKKLQEINKLMKQQAKLREEGDKLKKDLNDHKVQYPAQWTFPHNQGQNLRLVNIQQGSNQWNFAVNLFNATVPNQVVAITRIQNIELWDRFYFQSLLMTKAKKQINKRWLFHGTRQNNPNLIYGQKFGFDFRYSAAGAWGIGAYFAQNASYSNSYRHPLPNGRSCLFIACVLQGLPYKCGGNGNLRMPPVNPATNEQFDSVTSNDGSIVIVYEHAKAYPFYLIEYK